MADNKKYIGEGKLPQEPNKKLTLKLKDGSVTTNKIADGAVTGAKLGNDVKSTLNNIQGGMVRGISINGGNPKFPQRQGIINLVLDTGGGNVDETLISQIQKNSEDIADIFNLIDGVAANGDSKVKFIDYWQVETPPLYPEGSLWYKTIDTDEGATGVNLYVSMPSVVGQSSMLEWVRADSLEDMEKYINFDTIYVSRTDNKLYKVSDDANGMEPLMLDATDKEPSTTILNVKYWREEPDEANVSDGELLLTNEYELKVWREGEFQSFASHNDIFLVCHNDEFYIVTQGESADKIEHDLQEVGMFNNGYMSSWQYRNLVEAFGLRGQAIPVTYWMPEETPQENLRGIYWLGDDLLLYRSTGNSNNPWEELPDADADQRVLVFDNANSLLYVLVPGEELTLIGNNSSSVEYAAPVQWGSTIEPNTYNAGDYWYDTSSLKLKVYKEGNWENVPNNVLYILSHDGALFTHVNTASNQEDCRSLTFDLFSLRARSDNNGRGVNITAKINEYSFAPTAFPVASNTSAGVMTKDMYNLLEALDNESVLLQEMGRIPSVTYWDENIPIDTTLTEGTIKKNGNVLQYYSAYRKRWSVISKPVIVEHENKLWLFPADNDIDYNNDPDPIEIGTLQGGEDSDNCNNVIIVKYWTHSNVSGSAGTYSYNTTTKELRKWITGNDYEVITKNSDTLYVDYVGKTIYVWNGTDMLSVPTIDSTANRQSFYPISSGAVFDIKARHIKELSLDADTSAGITIHGKYDAENRQDSTITIPMATPQSIGLMSSEDKSKLNSLANPESLDVTTDVSGGLRLSAKDADNIEQYSAVIPLATTYSPGLITKEEKAKLANIENSDAAQEAVSLEERKNNPLYPEYWYCKEYGEDAEITYCPEFHKWPLVWYAIPDDSTLEIITGALSEDNVNSYSGEVFLPSEWIFPAWEYYYDNFINNNSSSETSEERINKWRNSPNTSSVYWIENYKRFVLYYDGVVYTDWSNRNLWMWEHIDDENNRNYGLYADTLYAQIPNLSVVTAGYNSSYDNGVTGWISYKKSYNNYSYTLKQWLPENNYQPNTKVWNGSTLVPAFDGISDFREALQQCFENNMGSVRLASGKLYYCTTPRNYKNIGGENIFEPIISIGPSISNGIFDGQGGGIFIRTIGGIDSTGTIDSNKSATIVRCYGSVPLFRIKGTSSNPVDGSMTIKNLTVASIRDNFEGGLWAAYATQPRFSIAGSGVNFVKIEPYVKNITFENIETYNLRSDFNISGADTNPIENILIRNCKSYCVTGNNLKRANNILFDNYHVTWNGWAGSGIHLFYFQGGSYGVFFRNCSFRQLDKYRQPMFDWQGGVQKDGREAEYAAYTERTTVFDNCTFEGAKLFFTSGAYYNPSDRTITFRNCTINTLWMEYCAEYCLISGESNHYEYGINDGKRANWEFYGCTIICPRAFMDTGTGTFNYRRLVLKDCILKRPRSGAAYYNHAFFPMFAGRYECSNCTVEIPRASDSSRAYCPVTIQKEYALPYIIDRRMGEASSPRHSVPIGDTAMLGVKAASGLLGDLHRGTSEDRKLIITDYSTESSDAYKKVFKPANYKVSTQEDITVTPNSGSTWYVNQYLDYPYYDTDLGKLVWGYVDKTSRYSKTTGGVTEYQEYVDWFDEDGNYVDYATVGYSLSKSEVTMVSVAESFNGRGTGKIGKALIGSTWSVKLTPNNGCSFMWTSTGENAPSLHISVKINNEDITSSVLTDNNDGTYTISITNVPSGKISIVATAKTQ